MYSQGKGSKVPKAERPKVKPLVTRGNAVMATERLRELRETCSQTLEDRKPAGYSPQGN